MSLTADHLKQACVLYVLTHPEPRTLTVEEIKQEISRLTHADLIRVGLIAERLEERESRAGRQRARVP
jgi:hypothetical protein